MSQRQRIIKILGEVAPFGARMAPDETLEDVAALVELALEEPLPEDDAEEAHTLVCIALLRLGYHTGDE